jgi:hypothetical protein
VRLESKGSGKSRRRNFRVTGIRWFASTVEALDIVRCPGGIPPGRERPAMSPAPRMSSPIATKGIVPGTPARKFLASLSTCGDNAEVLELIEEALWPAPGSVDSILS